LRILLVCSGSGKLRERGRPTNSRESTNSGKFSSTPSGGRRVSVLAVSENAVVVVLLEEVISTLVLASSLSRAAARYHNMLLESVYSLHHLLTQLALDDDFTSLFPGYGKRGSTNDVDRLLWLTYTA